jgi:hypothetical protein
VDRQFSPTAHETFCALTILIEAGNRGLVGEDLGVDATPVFGIEYERDAHYEVHSNDFAILPP